MFCKGPNPSAANVDQYLNVRDSVAYIGMETCKSCHSNVHETFQHTGMGQSFDKASPQKSKATYGDHVLVHDKNYDFFYKPYFRDSILYIMEFRLNGKDTVHKRIEQVDYIVGSGHHTNSHIIDINGYIFQAPITYYTQDKKWDMAPGYEKENLRFSRFLTTECLTCHNHYPTPAVGSINKYEQMPTGIECERCHGPGALHVKEKLAGNIVDTSKHIDYTIVNPSDLPRDLQMDLCQRCHLQGLAVLEPGKTFFDFKPGMQLSEVMNVFLPRYTNSHEAFIMASQADRLRLSKCFSVSETMTCLTCHHPHHSVQQSNKQTFNDACMTCHQKEKTTSCTETMTARSVVENNCVQCHMPPSGSIDIPHIRITDHNIHIPENTLLANIVNDSEKDEIARFLGLKMLTKEHPTNLDMARGYIAMHDKYVEAEAILDSAFYYLIQVKANNDIVFQTKVHYYFAKSDLEPIIQLASKTPPQLVPDGWTAYRIGEAYFAAGNFQKSLLYYKQATRLMPLHLDFQEKLATNYLQLQYLPQAKKVLEFIISENPKREAALSNLGYVYALQGQFNQAITYYQQALQLNPDHQQTLINEAALYLHLKDKSKAIQLLQRLIKINPEHPQALQLLSQLS